MSSDEILAELKMIRRLVAAQLFHALSREETSQPDVIATLANAGLAPRDIAELLGITPNAASVALTRLRKEGKVK